MTSDSAFQLEKKKRPVIFQSISKSAKKTKLRETQIQCLWVAQESQVTQQYSQMRSGTKIQRISLKV